jgi:predicted DNA-binding transcriptional regulator YafY
LQARRSVTRDQFLTDLEVSPATFKRDLQYMRDRLQVPIVWDRDAGGYRLSEDAHGGSNYQLPGLWFSAEEVHALLTMEQLLERLQPGLLGPQMRPLKGRIRKILDGDGEFPAGELNRRIRVLQMGVRSIDLEHFQGIASALLSRRRLNIEHFRRQSGDTQGREVSPQRLVYYRDNWYLDAWCHLRKALRTFSVDAIERVTVLGQRARTIKDETLDDTLGAGFGIFSGQATSTAVLRFDRVRARWVSREVWHPEQNGSWELDGAYVLEVPYSDPRELIMDILKYGADVEVMAPAELRELVRERLSNALSSYEH